MSVLPTNLAQFTGKFNTVLPPNLTQFVHTISRKTKTSETMLSRSQAPYLSCSIEYKPKLTSQKHYSNVKAISDLCACILRLK